MVFYRTEIDKNGTEIDRSVSLSSTRSANSTKLNSGSQNKNTTVRFVNSAAYIEKFSEMTSSNKEDICPLVDTKNNDIVSCLEKPTNYVPGLTNSAEYIEKTLELIPNNKEETCTFVDMKKNISSLITPKSRLPTFLNSAGSIEKRLEPTSGNKEETCSFVNMEDNDIVSSLEITINPISRFVNSAAYIKNILEPTSTNKKEVNSLLNMEKKDIIPPLKIPTNRQLSSTASRYDRDRNKIYREARNPELAYTQWLEQKNKLLTDRTIKQKQLEEEKRKRKELQNSVSATKVQEWFNKKKHAHSLKKIQESLKLLTDIKWECNKEREEKQKRLLKQIEINKQRIEIEERKQKATEAWEAWITKAAKKPKPVPLNKGLDSLRGAVSHSYVNPNQWQT